MGESLTTAGGLDVQAVRALFPVLHQKVHGHPLAYLDNGATTQMPQAVIDAMSAFEAHDRANIHRGVHTLSQRATDAFDGARAVLKTFFGAGKAHEFIFTSGTTEALNIIANGLWAGGAQHAWLHEGDEIIVSGLEHHANILPWQHAARFTGAKLLILKADDAGRVHEADLQKLLSPRTKVFSITACANSTGERPPYEALLSTAAKAGALTVLDAAQAASHAVPRMADLACNFLVFSGHKMYGPMGTGGIVGKRAALERLYPLRLGGDMVDWVSYESAGFAPLPARLEGGTPNVGGAVGLAAAAQFITAQGLSAIDAHVHTLRAHAVAGLQAIEGVRVLAPHAKEAALVSFVAQDAHPHDIGTLLDERGIAVRTGHHCAQPLLDQLVQGPTTRASFAIYNTHEEVDRLIEAVAYAVKALR